MWQGTIFTLFNNVIIYSKDKDKNDKFTWSFDAKNDLQNITTTKQNNYNKTRIEMYDCIKINEFYEKVKDIDKLTENLAISCLLSLIKKDNTTIEIKYYINEEEKANKNR